MRVDPKADKRFLRHMRDSYHCVVNDERCCRLKGAARVNHDLGWQGNSITICQQHLNRIYDEALQQIGRVAFEEMFDLDLVAIAQWCHWDYEGQLQVGDPPRGVYPIK